MAVKPKAKSNPEPVTTPDTKPDTSVNSQTITPPKPRKRTRIAKKTIDEKQLVTLINKGFTDAQIALQIGASETGVWRAKQRVFKQLSSVQHFKKHRVEYLIQQGFEERLIQSKLRRHLLDDNVVNKLTEEQKKRWYDTFNMSSGTIQDKEINIINNFGTQNIQINQVDKRRAEIKARLKELGVDPLNVNKLDSKIVECKPQGDK